MDCSGNGYCMADRTCQCLSGFSGADCNHGRTPETDPFVTDYDSRNEKESGEQSGSNDEEDGNGDDSSSDEDVESKDDGTDDSQDEDDEEEEAEIDPRVEQIAKKVLIYEKYLDLRMLRIQKASLKIELNKYTHEKYCMNTTTPNTRRCSNLKEKIERFTSIVTACKEKVDKLTAILKKHNDKIDSYLTEDQKKLYDQKRAIRNEERENFRSSEYNTFLDKWVTIYDNIIERYDTNLRRLKTELNQQGLTDRHKRRLESQIKRFSDHSTHFSELYDIVISKQEEASNGVVAPDALLKVTKNQMEEDMYEQDKSMQLNPRLFFNPNSNPEDSEDKGKTGFIFKSVNRRKFNGSPKFRGAN